MAPLERQEHTVPKDIELFDEKAVNSVVNLVSDVVREAVIRTARERPDLFLMDERELFKTLSKEKSRPGPTDNRLRIKFWDEYERTHFRNSEFSAKNKMDMTYVFSGVCTKHYFYNKYVKNAKKMAWLLSPPSGYTAKMQEMLAFGIEQFRDILDLPHFECDSEGDIMPGTINTKLLGIKAKIVGMVQERLEGSVMQKTMSVNFNASAKQVVDVATAESMAALDKRMEILDKRDRLKPKEEEAVLVQEVVSLEIPEEK